MMSKTTSSISHLQILHLLHKTEDLTAHRWEDKHMLHSKDAIQNKLFPTVVVLNVGLFIDNLSN